MNLSALMFLPELFLLIFAMGFLFINTFQRKDQEGAFLSTLFLPKGLYFGLIGLLLTFFIFSWINYPLHGVAFNGLLAMDKLIILAKVFMLCVGIGWFGLSQSSLSRSLKRDDYTHYEYPSLFLFTLIGSYIVVSSHHFIVMYLGLEIQTLPLYIALALRQDADTAIEAALKYFFCSITGSAFLLLGIGFIFGASGTLNFEEIFNNSDWIIHSPKTLLWFKVGFCLLLAGILFKLALVPFHLWVAPVYEGATLTQVAIFSALIKVAVMILLCRLLLKPFHSLMDLWRPLLIGVGFFSIAGGTLLALFQTHIRSLVAYATIAQLGYIIIGLGTGLFSGFVASLSYLFVYILTLVAFFFFWATLSHNDQNLETLSDIQGLSKQYPVQSFLMCTLLVSLAALPPFAGFWPKFFIFFSLIENYNMAYIGVLLLFSLIACFYYLRIIKKIYFEEGNHPINSSYDWKTVWSLIPLCVIGFIGVQNVILNIIREALKSAL